MHIVTETSVGDPAELGAAAGGPRARRALSRAALTTALASVVLPLTSLASGPLLARQLGPVGRGEVVAVMAPLFVLSFIANGGMPEATTYGIARLGVRPKAVFAAVSKVSLLYGVIASVGLWLVAPPLLHNAPGQVSALRWTVLALPFLMLVLVLRFAVNGMRDFLAANLERVINPVVRLGAFVVLALFGALDVDNAILWQILATLIGGAYLLVVLLRRGSRPQVVAESAPPPPGLTRTLAGYGARGWAGVFGNLVNWRLDQVLLVALVSTRQLGLYAVAVNFAEIPQTVVNQLRSVLFAEAAHRRSSDLVARAVRCAVFLTVTTCALGALVAPLAVRVLFGHSFAPAVTMTRVLLIGTVPFCVEQLVSAGLLASGHPGKRAFGQLSAAVLTVAGLFLLAPRLGGLGAALTSLIAYSVNCAISLAVFCRVSRLPLRQVVVPTPSDVRWLWSRVAPLLGKVRRKVLGRA